MKEKKTNWRKKVFKWHMWAGVAFAIPVFLVSLTAVFIAHEDGLSTEKLFVKAGWLPGYQYEEENIAYFLDDIKAQHIDVKNNTIYYGTKLGLIKKQGESLNIIKGSEGIEVRDILSTENELLFFATKNGIFKYHTSKGEASKMLAGDFHGLSQEGEMLYAMAGKHGYYTSNDKGQTWSDSKYLSDEMNSSNYKEFSSQIKKSGVAEDLSLKKLVLDIHTGEAFLGKGSMWLWIDIIALSLILMTFTGFWMWYKRKLKKKKPRRAVKSVI